MSGTNHLRRRSRNRTSIYEARHVRDARRETLRKMQGNQCCWCGKPMQHEKNRQWDFETFEHLVPRSKGGTDEMANLALAHQKCNRERGNSDREPLLRRVAAPR